MTASTAPITLPGAHRQAQPVWPFHTAIAWVTFAVLVAGWAIATAVHRIDFAATRAPRSTHRAAIAAAIALIIAALAAAFVLL